MSRLIQLPRSRVWVDASCISGVTIQQGWQIEANDPPDGWGIVLNYTWQAGQAIEVVTGAADKAAAEALRDEWAAKVNAARESGPALRDLFAAAAMAGLIARSDELSETDESTAYYMANALIRYRDQEG